MDIFRTAKDESGISNDEIAALLGLDGGEYVRKAAMVHCHGTENVTKKAAAYQGIVDVVTHLAVGILDGDALAVERDAPHLLALLVDGCHRLRTGTVACAQATCHN